MKNRYSAAWKALGISVGLETKLMNNDRPAKTSDEVLEVDATDEVAAIYADIRETMAMPFVNLIWRRLALSPEGLRWTWYTMKPLYSDGAENSYILERTGSQTGDFGA